MKSKLVKFQARDYIIEKLRSGLPVSYHELTLYLPLSPSYSAAILKTVCRDLGFKYSRGVCMPEKEVSST